MNTWVILLALESYGQPQQWLAIAGGGALGAFGTGLAAQLLSRWLTTRKLPPLPVMAVRGIGGVVVGLLTAMWVLQGGSWGLGGPGGPPHADGPGTKSSADKGPGKGVAEEKKTPAENKDDAKATSTSSEVVMRIWVLNDKVIEKLPGGLEAIAEQRYYRLSESEDATKLLTLAKVKEAVKMRLVEKPALQRVDIVGPDKTAGRVSPLGQWAESRDLKVDYLQW